jgi:L-proline amide hydrolase
MLRHEGAGTLDDPEYQDAVAELYARYLYRTTPYDPARSRAELAALTAEYMPEMGPAYALWGPHEFMGTGPQAHFDCTDRLGEIRVPALVVCGWYDELTPARCSRPLSDGIAGSEFVVFGNSSHLTIFEHESEPYLAVIRDFLERHDL